MCMMNAETRFWSRVKAMTTRGSAKIDAIQTRFMGSKVERMGGTPIGTVVEVWVGTADGLVPLSTTAGLGSTSVESDSRWFEANEGYLEIWETLTPAEVAVHCVPFSEIAGVTQGQIFVKDGWSLESALSSAAATRQETPRSKPKVVKNQTHRAVAERAQQHWIQHVD